MTRPAHPIAFLLPLALAAGCASPASWRYEARSPIAAGAPLDLRIAVTPFEDRRGHVNSDSSLAFLVPGVPFGLAEHDRVEAGTGYVTHSEYRANPPRDLGEALTQEVLHSRLFLDVDFVDEVELLRAKRRLEFDYYLSGSVSEMGYRGGTISYFASVAGPVLWIFGAPSSFSKNSLVVDVVLRRSHDDRIVWKGARFAGARSSVRGLYYASGGELAGWPELMAEACAEWISDLRVELARSPGEFKRFRSDERFSRR